MEWILYILSDDECIQAKLHKHFYMIKLQTKTINLLNFLLKGKLTTEQIRAGYASLKRIEECLKKKNSNKELLDACNQFYTRIPHDFG